MNDQNNTPEIYERSFFNFLAVTDITRHEALAKYFKGGIYVDIGCFDSIMPVILSERYPQSEIWALDYATKVIEFLSIRFPKVHYITHDCSKKLPWPNESVDYVVAGEFIEHLVEPWVFIDEALRILKPGGYLAVSTPFNEGEAKLVGGIYHVWSFDLDDIRSLMKTANMKLLKEENSTTILAWRKKCPF